MYVGLVEVFSIEMSRYSNDAIRSCGVTKKCELMYVLLVYAGSKTVEV